MSEKMPPNYYAIGWDELKRREFDHICSQLEIGDYYSQEFRHVAGRKIAFIVDNSGSMGGHLNQTSTVLADRRSVRRYDELIEFVRMAVPLLAFDSPEGVDFWFLNAIALPGTLPKRQFQNIQAWDQISELFNIPPNGSTPLVAVIKECIRQYHHYIDEQGLLLIISTDGQPDEGPRALYKIIKNRPSTKKFTVNFRVCTDCPNDIAYLNKLDRRSPGVDVCDDYNTEKQEVARAHPGHSFNMNEYVMKCIIGGASTKLDSLDESQCQIL
jgi:hypothetical protein